jgi:hypothetical protein
MAYMRGEPYIWSDGEKLHIWSKSGNDGWADMEGLHGIAEASGVALNEQHADEFAVMRFAELVHEGRLQVTIERALRQWGGNFGTTSLSALATALVEACASLPPPN